MVKVFVHGRLQTLLPERLLLSVGSPAEAVRALCAVAPGARAMLEEGEWRIAAGAEPVALDTLGLGLGACQALHIHPHASAAGSGAPVLDGPSLVGTAYALTAIPHVGDYAAREAPDQRPTYPYDGPVNAAAQGGRVPLIYGGPIRVGATAVSAGIDAERVQLTEGLAVEADEPRTFVEGDARLRTRATLRAVDLIGEGPMRGLVDGLKSVYIDGTAVENADGTRNVEGFHLSWRSGTRDQTPTEAFAEVSAPQRFSEKVTKAGPVTRTIRSTRDSARLTLRFPRLETITAEGDALGASVRFKIEVQPSGGTFATVLGPQTISDRSVAPAELSWRVPLTGEAPYTVRVRRLSEDAAEGISNDLYWVGLDELTEVRPSYPHTALVGIEAEADKVCAQHTREYEVYGRIVEVPSNYDPDTRAYTGTWDGTFKRAWTDNGAWCVFDLLRSPRYGLGAGLDAARIEAAKWALYSIARFNDELVDDGQGGTEPRYRFSGVIAAQADAARVLADMLSNFRAGHYHGEGAIEPVQDSHKVFPASDAAAVARAPVALLGPANVRDGAFEYADAEPHARRASAVAVSFSDPTDGYRLGIERVVDDALVARYGYRQKDVVAMYCTSRAQAHRLGRHLLIEQEREPGTVRYRAGLDQAAVRPGDVVRIADPLTAGDRAAARILSVLDTDADTVTGAGVIARALITVGEDANWYSRHAGQSIGEATGELSLDTNITLSRVMFYTDFARLRLNRSGTGSFSSWYGAGGAGLGKSVYLAFGASLIELDIDQELIDSGNSFLNLTVPADAIALARSVEIGDKVNLVIADTGTGVRSSVLIPDRLPAGAPNGAAADWSAHVVLADGSVLTRPVTAFEPAAGRVTVSPGLTSIPLAGAMCVLESASAPSTQWRVLSVRETDGLELEFLARQYDPGRYAAVETGLTLAPTVSDEPGGRIPAPASVSLHERLYEDAGATRSALAVGVEDPAGGRDARVSGIDCQMRRTAGEDTDYRALPHTEAGLAELTEVRPGTYRARARYIGRNGALRSPWTESDEVTVAGFAELADPAGVAVTAIAGGYSASWDAAPERDYAYTEILDRVSGATAEVVGRSAASPWPLLGLDDTERHVSVRHVDRAGRKTGASTEIAVTPLEADVEAARTAAAAAAASAAAAESSATQAREAIDGIDDAVTAEVRSRLDTTLAPAIVLRQKTNETERLEPARLADLSGAASTAQIDAGALRVGDDFDVSAEGRLIIADAARPVVPLWGGNVEVPANGNIVTVDLSADMRPFGVIDGIATAGASPYAAVPVGIVAAGAIAGTASARPASARKFAVVLDAAASAEVYYWRSADGETLYLQNDTADSTPLPVRLFSLEGVWNSGVQAPPAPT